MAGKTPVRVLGRRYPDGAAMEPGRDGREDRPWASSWLVHTVKPQWSPAVMAGKTCPRRRVKRTKRIAAMEPGRDGREDVTRDLIPRVEAMPQWSPAVMAGKTTGPPGAGSPPTSSRNGARP